MAISAILSNVESITYVFRYLAEVRASSRDQMNSTAYGVSQIPFENLTSEACHH